MQNPKFYQGTVECSDKISEGMRCVRIQLPAGETLSFLPGQYVGVHLPERDEVAYYSIATSPSSPSAFELIVKEDPLAQGASYMYGLQPGDPINFDAPMGEAYFRADARRPLIFVAGASGASYVRSMLQYLQEQGQLGVLPIHYFYGVRTEDELIEIDWLHGLSEAHEDFHFIPALSGLSRWSGATGLITDVMDACLINEISGFDAYVAGSHAMVNAAAGCLIRNKGLPEDHFFSDMYGTDL